MKTKKDLENERCARKLRALADPERLRIVACLRKGPQNVSSLAAELETEVVNVSHHLGVLRNADLVQDQRQGRYVIYRLHPDVFDPNSANNAEASLDLGCCRLEIPQQQLEG